MKNFFTPLFIIVFVSCTTNQQKMDKLNLESKLSGEWRAVAFDGELHEKWTLTYDGWMQQEGYYIEQKDTSYSAETKIEQIGDELILFSVIKNSNPKIFKAISVDENMIIFENDDYKNPFEVKYEFLSTQNYRRTIRGYEKDSLVIYEFNFEKSK